MDALRLGAAFRAVRLRRGWRQLDVARRSGTSLATVSRIERGLLNGTSIDTVVRISSALEVRVEWQVRWRGGELDRMLNAGHAAMHESVARLLNGLGWQTAPEASFAIFGERGIVDVLAFHPQTRSLLVVELKTDLVDVQGLIGAVDRYRRLAPRIASERGWSPASVSCWVVLRDRPSNRRRVANHAGVLHSAFPRDGRAIRGWLRRPVGTVACLSFLSDSHPMRASAASSGTQRVHRRPASVAGTGARRQLVTE